MAGHDMIGNYIYWQVFREALRGRSLPLGARYFRWVPLPGSTPTAASIR